MLSSKLRKKVRMSAFTTSIQLCTKGSSKDNYETNKRHSDRNKEVQLSLSTSGMILHIENSSESTKIK